MKMSAFLFLFISSLSASADTFIETNHAQLFCRAMGKGTPIIVLHGGPGLSQDYLLPQMSKLAEDHLVIFYDQRGSGRSKQGDDPSFINPAVFVEDLEAIRKEFGLQKATIIGHSRGGLLAIHYAISHPEAIDKLILLSSTPASSDDFDLFLQEFLRRTDSLQEELEEIQTSKEFLAGDPETVTRFLKVIFRVYCAEPQKVDQLNLRVPPQGDKTSDSFNQALFPSSFDLYSDLKKISCKTLIVHGDKDPIPISTAENIHRSIPKSKLVVMKDCGHFPFVEKPEEFFTILNEFLEKNAANP